MSTLNVLTLLILHFKFQTKYLQMYSRFHAHLMEP
jgi:hypothetical protein